MFSAIRKFHCNIAKYKCGDVDAGSNLNYTDIAAAANIASARHHCKFVKSDVIANK